MSHTHLGNAVYSPYGAFELKAKYQRNLLLAMITTTLLIVLGWGLLWAMSVSGDELVIDAPPIIIQRPIDLPPPPTIILRPPEVQPIDPNVVSSGIGLIPVSDDEVMDEDDIIMASRTELAAIVPPDLTEAAGGRGIVVDISEEHDLPALIDYTPMEIPPEMIFSQPAEYPRLARQAGIEGLVWIKALVLKDGTVKEAVVFKSSGTPSLDEAALKAAHGYKYSPAIQNGKAIAVWISYRVRFELGTR